MSRALFCATVASTTTSQALDDARAAAPRADLIEIRLDCLEDPDVEAIVKRCPRPVVLTCRSRAHGGRFAGSEDRRLDLLGRGVGAGAAWVDVELDSPSSAVRFPEAKRIVSFHDPERTPRDLAEVLRRIEAASPDVAKIVTRARTPSDVAEVLSLYRLAKGPLAAHPMGVEGFPGRVLAAALGAAIVYGAAVEGTPGAPGQPSLRTLLDDYRLSHSRREGPALVLLGRRLAYSVSPAMVNRSLASLGVGGVYLPWEVQDPEGALDVLPDLGVVGAAITIPFKERVLSVVDEVDPTAMRLGAVNTIVRSGGRLLGMNTDLSGAIDALRSELPDLEGVRSVVLGAGGAARAISYGLRGAGAEVTVVNRTPDRAARLAKDVGCRVGRLEETAAEDVDLLVNATPVGQWPEVRESIVPARFLRPGMVVMDAVYNPRETRLLREARLAGCRVVPGMEMLARQASTQLGLWLGVCPPPSLLASEGYRELSRRNRTVLLVGMRGAGKTTVGRALADKLGREFVDVDRDVERTCGLTVSEIFERMGSEEFRRRERESLSSALAAEGRIVAAGGGVVESEEALDIIGASGARVVYLSAPASVLFRRIRGSDRPALTDLPLKEEVARLLAHRVPSYRKISHVVVDATSGGPGLVAERIIDVL